MCPAVADDLDDVFDRTEPGGLNFVRSTRRARWQ